MSSSGRAFLSSLNSAVVIPPASVRRHFLPWDRPLVPSAVAFLTEGWDGSRALDLSSLLVIVPTSQSGRRLREALASHAAERGQAVFSPRVLTPNALLALEPGPGLATRLESLLAWAAVFRELELDEFRDVFPVDPPERNFNWSLRLGRDFGRLQKTLLEGGLTLSDVVAKAGEAFPEAARWEQIARLEQRQIEKLERFGLRDEAAATLALVDAAKLLDGVRKIVLLGTPDPLPLALSVLERYAQSVPLEVVVFAPPDEANAFDGWGRPLAAIWSSRTLDLPEFEQRVQLCADPAAQADRVVELAKNYGDPDGILGVGVGDGEVLPLLEASLRHEGFEAFNPEGRSRLGDGLFQLLRSLAALAQEDSFAAVESLARCPDFLEFLLARFGETFSAAEFLSGLDKLRASYLPPTLAEARRHRPDSRELMVVAELRSRLVEGRFPENAAAVLEELFANRRFDLGNATDAAAASAAEAWAGVMDEIARAAEHFERMPNSDWWEVALLAYGSTVRGDEKPDGAVELNGWLELLWEDAPHLVVSGLNDGLVPEAVVGDAFVPESLRERLQLKTNGERFARDAYLLQALASARSQHGRLDLLCGKSSVAGDPLRPSRLLLRCPDAELPERVRFLFRAVDSVRASPAWQRSWQLTPRQVAPPDHVAVTSLREWLRCPFRFYLSKVLRMKAVEPAKSELDAMDFGTLCHAALEAMGQDATMRNCKDPEALREFLLSRLEQAAARKYGRQLTLPLVIQIESARQRLSRVAEIQAETRAAGWVIEQVEQPFEIDVGGLLVRGKVDRVDRHETTGAVRVLDYKTSDRLTPPAEAHWRKARRANETAPDFARLLVGGTEWVWQDLQLPLYQRALAGKFPGEIACGYFNLPKASTETRITAWEDLTPDLAESAWRCAEGVARAIRSGQFWPPNEDVAERFDDYASLFHHGVTDSVHWEGAGR